MVEIATPHAFHDLWVYKVTFRVTNVEAAPSLIQDRYPPSLGLEFTEVCASKDMVTFLRDEHAAYANLVQFKVDSICIGEFRDW